MKLKGKFIKDEWTGRYTWLRRISRETKTTAISETQRFFKDFGDGVNDRVFFEYRNKKYRKHPDGTLTKVGSIKKYRDIHSTLTIVDKDDLSPLKCKYSFKELFDTDVREIQNFHGYPNDRHYPQPLKRLTEFWGWKNLKLLRNETKFFKLRTYIELLSNEIDSEQIDFPYYPIVIKYLEDIFKVPVYGLKFRGKVDESWGPFSKLTDSLTYFQVTHFGDDKKIISDVEDAPNCTIAFWYFDDKLIIQSEAGKDTW